MPAKWYVVLISPAYGLRVVSQVWPDGEAIRSGRHDQAVAMSRELAKKCCSGYKRRKIPKHGHVKVVDAAGLERVFVEETVRAGE